MGPAELQSPTVFRTNRQGYRTCPVQIYTKGTPDSCTLVFMVIILTAKHLITANAIIDRPLITLDGGTIVDISSRKATEGTNLTHDFKDLTLTAGLLDIHMH